MISREKYWSHFVDFFKVLILFSMMQHFSCQDHSGTYEVKILSTRSLNSCDPELRLQTPINLCLKHFQKIPIFEENCTFGNNSIQYPAQKGTNFNLYEKISNDFVLFASFLDQRSGEYVNGSITGFLNPSEKWSTQQMKISLSNEKISDIELSLQYRIKCTQYHYGQNCNKICIPPLDGSYTCDLNGERKCKPGFEGINCSSRCIGTCKNGFCDANGTCRCSNGWTGRDCNQCKPLPGCQGGTCSKPNECLCLPGYEGKYCTTKSKRALDCSGFCKNGGICNLINNNRSCSCPPGFAGTQCEKKISSCDENPCKNNGECKMDNSSDIGFTCECPKDFYGRYCQVKAETCRDRPCQNGAACIKGSNGFHCECTTFWYGKICDIPLTLCRADSCFNGGECEFEPTKSSGFKCKCNSEFYGERCEKKISDLKVCKNFTCYNGGSCYSKSSRTAACECPEGYGGEHCENNLCECKNGGICDTKSIDHKNKCICLGDFYGEKCEFRKLFLSDTKAASAKEAASSSFPLWPILIIGIIIIASIIMFGPKYWGQRNRLTSSTNQNSISPINHLNKQYEIEMVSTVKNSFCSSAPPFDYHSRATSFCRDSPPRRTISENQYSYDPTSQRELATPEPLREAERQLSSKNIISPQSETSHVYESIHDSRNYHEPESV